jgi:hypothetical protein
MTIADALKVANCGLPKARKISARLGALDTVLLAKLCSDLDCTVSDVVAAGIRVLYDRQKDERNEAPANELATPV